MIRFTLRDKPMRKLRKCINALCGTRTVLLEVRYRYAYGPFGTRTARDGGTRTVATYRTRTTSEPIDMGGPLENLRTFSMVQSVRGKLIIRITKSNDSYFSLYIDAIVCWSNPSFQRHNGYCTFGGILLEISV